MKCVTAHDLQCSFGERWAMKVMPQARMPLMPHESIETTNRYDVGRNAENTAEVLWATDGNKTGNSHRNAIDERKPERKRNTRNSGVSESSGDGTRTRDSRIMNAVL